MTHSNTINSTITKETEATKARAGSSKTESIQIKSKSNTYFLSIFGKEDLILNSVDGNMTAVINAPENGWTYEALAAVNFFDISVQYANFYWNIYIGGCHLGNESKWLYMGSV